MRQWLARDRGGCCRGKLWEAVGPFAVPARVCAFAARVVRQSGDCQQLPEGVGRTASNIEKSVWRLWRGRLGLETVRLSQPDISAGLVWCCATDDQCFAADTIQSTTNVQPL
eukprot:355317-Chlamydomonas_euryale.AAC.4